MSLDIAQEQRGEVRILALTGRLDLDSAATLQLALEDLIGAGAAHVVLDLSALGYLSNAGAEVIVATADRLKAAGSLRLCGLAPGLREVLAATAPPQRIPQYADRAAALADHPSARLDPGLVGKAAELIGATPTAKSGKADPAIAQAAAALLGAGAPKPAPATKPVPIPEPVPEPPKKDGLLDKLKGLFGGE
jgi:anti-anti-sigma factor